MLSVLTVTALAQGLKVSPWSYRNYRNKLAVVLGDYKTDPDAELERPERISLVDAATAELKIMELDYSSRWLGRGPHGEALVLGTDGAPHVLDPDSGANCGASRWYRRGPSRTNGSSRAAASGYMPWTSTPEESGSAPNCRTCQTSSPASRVEPPVRRFYSSGPWAAAVSVPTGCTDASGIHTISPCSALAPRARTNSRDDKRFR